MPDPTPQDPKARAAFRRSVREAAYNLPSPPSVTPGTPDPDNPETWAFPGPPDFSGEWPANLPRFGPVPERIEVTYCTDFCGDSCTCRLAGSHVIYCRGCGEAWLEPPETRPLADPPVEQPSFCACTCRDGDPHYEDWVTDPWVCACGMIAPKGEFRVFPHDDCDGGRVLTLGELQADGSMGT